MKASDRAVLLGLVILGVLAAFWFLVLSPKRDRAGELEQQATDLQAEVTQQEQLAAAAEEAQGSYEQNYERLIVLGKAAPADGDTPSLVTQLSAAAKDAGTRFDSLVATAESAAPVSGPAQTTTDQNAEAAASAESTSESASQDSAAATPAPATEASASLLPLGATVGPAGLGVMPYTLEFHGDFFSMADLLQRIDRQVGAGRTVKVDGRLLTVGGFTMTPDEDTGDLAVELSITSYVLPQSQGLTAGATPAAPPAEVPAATTVPTSTTPSP